jgi:hypothetical protein
VCETLVLVLVSVGSAIRRALLCDPSPVFSFL